MGIFEFLMLVCFGFSWPFSIAKSIRSRSAKGKSIMFMLLVELGYVFGIIHKILNNNNWVIWMYIALFFVVAVDIALYFRNRRFDLAASRASAPALAVALLLLVPTVADAAPAAENGRSFVVTNVYEETVSGWTTNCWPFAPTVCYGGNRFRVVPMKYPPYLLESSPDMPVTMADLYRLSTDGAPAKIEWLAGDSSAPLLGWFDPRARRGVVILADPFTEAGETGFAIEEDPASGKCTFRVSAPGVRSRMYRMTRFVPSDDRPADPARKVPLGILRLECSVADVNEYLDFVFSHRKDITPRGESPRIEPFGKLCEYVLGHYDADKWYSKDGVEYIADKPDSDCIFWHLQIGWCGAPHHSLPYVLAPNAERARRVARTFDAMESMQGASGFFYAIRRGKEIFGDAYPDPVKYRVHTMVRRQSVAICAVLQQMRAMENLGYPVRKEWREMCRRAADALVKVWMENGQLGHFLDAETGRIVTWNSTNGALVPAALLLCEQEFGGGKYAAAAAEIGEYFLREHLAKGYSGGGPCEALQCPDSESIGELAVSFERLWERTGDGKWLKAARDAVALYATWVDAWDYPLPPDSREGRLGTHTTGAVWANLQNRHGAPGPFFWGHDVFLRVWRATDDERVFELLRDSARGCGQYVHTPLHPVIPGGTNGAVSERVNTGDWEERSGIGNSIDEGDSNLNWCSTVAMEMMENPGVYVLLDGDGADVRAIDRVEARWIDGSLELVNTTAWDTTVSVLAETKEERRRPLSGETPSLGWIKVSIKSGERSVLPRARLLAR